MGTLEQGPRDQGSWRATGLALKGLTPATAQDLMSRLTTAGTAKPVRPTGAFQCRFALHLGAELLKKRGQRQARLKLDAIHRHDSTLQGE